MQVEQIKTFKKLADRLKTDRVFRYTCGFNIFEPTPSRLTFSRFLTKLSRTSALEKHFEALVICAKKLEIVGGTRISIDSTHEWKWHKIKSFKEV